MAQLVASVPCFVCSIFSIAGAWHALQSVASNASAAGAGGEPWPRAKAADAATDPATDPAADPASDMAPGMAENVLAEPIVPTQVTINQFALSLMGARITATGELKAAEGADIATAPPIGQIKAEYEGVNGLVDKLAGMGLIPEDQLMGVRMMLAMFAKPVAEGEDKLTTDLEFKEGGAIFANGQQIQ